MGFEYIGVILNEMNSVGLPEPAQWEEHQKTFVDHDNKVVREISRLTQRWINRVERQNKAKSRLLANISAPLVELPLLPDRSLNYAELHELSVQLESGLGPS